MVAGFIAFKSGDLEQLYIDKDCQGLGLGAALLDIAKVAHPEGLKTYTFQRNKLAQRFYEKHGFTIVKYGTENEENLPDILYEWKSE